MMEPKNPSIKPIKILVFYQYFGTPKGGWSTRFYEFARRWAKNGNEVTIVTSPYYKSDIKAAGFITKGQIEGVNLIIINTPDSNKVGVLKRAINALTFAVTSTYFALTLSHDLVLASSGPITIGIPALFSRIFRGKKMVFEVRDLWPRGGIELGKLTNPELIKAALWFEKVCYSKSAMVVACSDGMESGVLEVSPSSKTLVIPNSSDVELFSQASGLPKDLDPGLLLKPLFVYIGSLGLMDDCSQIVAGVKAAEKLDFNLVFIGDGEEKECLEAKVSELGLEDKVHFLGLIPKEEVAKWLRIASASFVTFKDIPVLGTNSPNKLFDSFAAGVPVIQSTGGWIKTLVENSKSGWNVDPADPQTFADAIAEVVNSPDELKLRSGNAKRLALEKFDRNILSEKYEYEMRSLLS